MTVWCSWFRFVHPRFAPRSEGDRKQPCFKIFSAGWFLIAVSSYRHCHTTCCLPMSRPSDFAAVLVDVLSELTSIVCSRDVSSYFWTQTSGRKCISPFALAHVTVGVGVPTTMALNTANFPALKQLICFWERHEWENDLAMAISYLASSQKLGYPLPKTSKNPTKICLAQTLDF